MSTRACSPRLSTTSRRCAARGRAAVPRERARTECSRGAAALHACAHPLTRASPRGTLQVVATAPKGGSGDAETEADNVQKAHAAAALYLALMQLPGARSHVFNEFTFRSVVQSIRCIVVAPPSRGDKEKGKKRKARAAAGAGLSRAQRAEKREGTRKSARVGGSSAASRQHADEDEDEDEDEDDMKLCQSDDEDADDVSGSPRGSGTHDQSDEEQRSLGMQLLCQARQLAANLSLQTCPQAHDQLARVSVETALSLPSSTPEAAARCSVSVRKNSAASADSPATETLARFAAGSGPSPPPPSTSAISSPRVLPLLNACFWSEREGALKGRSRRNERTNAPLLQVHRLNTFRPA